MISAHPQGLLWSWLLSSHALPWPGFCSYVCGRYSVLFHATTLIKDIKDLSHTEYL